MRDIWNVINSRKHILLLKKRKEEKNQIFSKCNDYMHTSETLQNLGHYLKKNDIFTIEASLINKGFIKLVCMIFIGLWKN